MIIQRFTEAIRSQNWTNVLVEFLIVVFGIFVALQADNWNETRLDRKHERESLERLLREAENAVAFIDQQIKVFSSIIDSQRVLLEIVASDDQVPENTEVATQGFQSLTFYPAMAPARTAYDELIATGGIQLIRSRAVRNSVALYHAELDFFQTQLDYFRASSLGDGGDPYIPARDYVRAIYDPSAKSSRRFEIDWLGLRSDPYVESLFVDKLRNQIVMNGNRQRVLDRAKIMCDTLAEAVERQCRPARSDDSERPSVLVQ